MGDNIITGIVGILTAVIGVAIIAVIVSKNSQTSQVLTSGGNAFSSILQAATGPVTGGGSGLGFSGLNGLSLTNA